jgi:hypothetical protein
MKPVSLRTFAVLHAAFALSSRPINLYSALPVIPFGFIALGFAADRLLKFRAWWFLGACALWSLYLLQLAVGRLPVPKDPSAWLLKVFGIL